MKNFWEIFFNIFKQRRIPSFLLGNILLTVGGGVVYFWCFGSEALKYASTEGSVLKTIAFITVCFFIFLIFCLVFSLLAQGEQDNN